MGIIQSIIVWVDCWRGSGDGICVIFCCTQVVTATRMGIMTGEGSGRLKSSHRKWLLTGAAAWIGMKVIQG